MLNRFGSWKTIRELESGWQKFPVSVVNLKVNDCASANIAVLMRKKADHLYHIRTKSGKYLRASGDHPVYTPEGMKDASDLNAGDEIVTYPFSGVEHEEPSADTIVTIDDVAAHLDRIGITDRGNAKAQVLSQLKRLGILPLRYDSPQLPILIKIMGFVFGDGVLTFLKNRKGFVHFYGQEEDLESIRDDLRSIGLTAQNIHKRTRKHEIRTQYSLVRFEAEEKLLLKKSTGFAALLAMLGVPAGRKTHAAYRMPEWLKKARLWQKRLFLSALFGAEMSKPKTLNRYNFYCPQLNMNKAQHLLDNGNAFLADIRDMLAEFGVDSKAPVRVAGNDYHGVHGPTNSLRLLILSNPANLIRLYEKIGFSYNRKRQKLACLAIDYLRLKESAINAKDSVVAGHDGNLLIKRRVNAKFISFGEFVATNSFGDHGLTVDRIEEIERAPYDGYVYDFTVNHKDHNFIADNVVTHNCGMRLITTNLTYDQVKPKLRELVDTFFRSVPSGVGAKGFVKTSKSQFEEMMTTGVKWCVDNGYGWKEDIERVEEYGVIKGADPGKVSSEAVSRGINQLGTLGSGNHYLEIQHVLPERIHDPAIAEQFGIFPNQVVVMVHCGSRGFGHQIATDYLRVFDKVMQEHKMVVRDRELACAPFSTQQARDYYGAMACAANMAFANRQVIVHRIREGFAKVFGQPAEDLGLNIVYDVAHNIAKIEEHMLDGKRKKVIVHRKGSTRSFGPGHEELAPMFQKTGQPVILGGSMETGSYLLVGTKKAEMDTFGSTAHGSGRTMSRTRAKQLVRGDQLQQDMERKGIYVKAASMPGLAEEAGMAYKDIADVVEAVDRAGISRKVVGLRPIGNIKG
ncbi:MAG: RtcB family protein [Candidatus Aenigmarchaeota archaeon]|nr:RtcB family protein [Candidatus Aenigmarchaeota archaeon]